MKYISYILLALLLIACGVIAWFWFNPKIEQVYVKMKPTPEIVYIEKGDGGTIATVEKSIANNPAETLSEKYVNYVNDTLVPALNKGLRYKAEVTELTRINAALRDSLSKKNIAINTVKKDVIHWQTKYISIAANPTDSTVTYAYNAQIDIAEYEKKESLFGDKKTYIAVTSPDKNFRINGMENFTKAVKVPKDFLELNLKLQGLYMEEQFIPYGGAELLFNPDGKIKPIIGYGYFYNNSNGQIYPYWMAGLQFNLIRF